MIEIAEIFRLLNDWRGLPSYKLEPRVDIFFALYLPEILMHNIKELKGEIITHDNIIPEFPLLKKRFDKDNYVKKRDGNRSKKADYAVFSKNRLYLIELKTDMGSIDKKQENYMIQATTVPPSELIRDINEVVVTQQNKKYGPKYNYLSTKLSNLCEQFSPTEVVAVYIQPELQNNQNEQLKTITFEQIYKEVSSLDKDFCTALEWWENPPLCAKSESLQHSQ